jgi:hypothetical protein
LHFFERATVVVLAVLLVTALVRYVRNDMERVATSNPMRGIHYLSSYSARDVATRTR